MGAYTDQLEVGTLNLAGREPWVRELLDWADSETHLSRIARRQYVAWHCLGRQVLKVELTRSGLRVTSGVDYSKPALDKPPAVTLDVSVSLQAGDLQRVKTAAQAAVERRLAGHDKDNEEHRLQHALEAHKYLLGLERIEREFAAWRPLRRAFIDFLGVDRARCLHIIETKIGPDPMLGLQGLDYWVWARAHERSLAAHFQVSEFSSIVVDFVVGPKPRKTSLVDQYAISTVEALSEEVDWRFHRIDHWREHPTLSSLGLREMPDHQGRGSRPQR